MGVGCRGGVAVLSLPDRAKAFHSCCKRRADSDAVDPPVAFVISSVKDPVAICIPTGSLCGGFSSKETSPVLVWFSCQREIRTPLPELDSISFSSLPRRRLRRDDREFLSMELFGMAGVSLKQQGAPLQCTLFSDQLAGVKKNLSLLLGAQPLTSVSKNYASIY